MPSVHNVIVPLSAVDLVLKQQPLDDVRRMVAKQATAEGVDDPAVMATTRSAIVACLQSFLAEHALADDRTHGMKHVRTAKFDDYDVLGYVGSFWSWFGKVRKAKWITPSPVAMPMPSPATFALFADWGTGLYGAPSVATAISALGVDVAVHLGDVYYSGTWREYADRVAPFWPTATVTRVCNGNHDMYSGGHAYFNFAQTKCGQHSSCFAFENEHWLVLGLDTAYVDADISEAQALWIDAMITRYQNRSVILLSHHQPWSAYADDHHAVKALPTRVKALKNKQIHSWYWGHEHRCAIYNQHPQYGTYGRCLGVGGFPYKRDDISHLQPLDRGWYSFAPTAECPVGGMVLDVLNGWLDDSYGAHGFAAVTLEPHSLTESIITADGVERWTQTR